MFTLSVWARLVLPITDGRTYGRLPWVLFFLTTFLVCNGDKRPNKYQSANLHRHQITLSFGGDREEKKSHRPKKDGIWQLWGHHLLAPYRNYQRKPHIAKDEEWSYRIRAIGRTLNTTSSKIIACYERWSRLLDQLYCANYPIQATSCKGGVFETSTLLQGPGLATSFSGRGRPRKNSHVSSVICSGNQELTFPSTYCGLMQQFKDRCRCLRGMAEMFQNG